MLQNTNVSPKAEQQQKLLQRRKNTRPQLIFFHHSRENSHANISDATMQNYHLPNLTGSKNMQIAAGQAATGGTASLNNLEATKTFNARKMTTRSSAGVQSLPNTTNSDYFLRTMNYLQHKNNISTGRQRRELKRLQENEYDSSKERAKALNFGSRFNNSQSLNKLKAFTAANESKVALNREFSMQKFLINKNDNNIQSIKGLICGYINSNKRYFNREVINIPEFDKRSSVQIDSVKFVDKVLPENELVRKTFGFDEENLARNNLVLEKVFLERIVRKERGKYLQQTD